MSRGSELQDRARKYGLETEIDALLAYLETNGDIDGDRLPEWSEFQALAADYEVSLPHETDAKWRNHSTDDRVRSPFP